MSVAHTSFSNIPFIETVSETLTEEPDKENPFATMD
jgi:hypothetical protein